MSRKVKKPNGAPQKVRLLARAANSLVTDSFGLLFICGCSFFLRTHFIKDQVLAGGKVFFLGNDAWYHMRLAESLTHNFPFYLTFDPYLAFPKGEDVDLAPFFDLLVSLAALILGLGSPSAQLVDKVGAYLPAVAGAAVCVPVFFLGKAVSGRPVGFLAAAILAVSPGHFLGRSMLGFADHHVLETLFSSLVLLFLILELKSFPPGTANGTAVNLRKLRGPLLWGLAAGLWLGCYLFSWSAGAVLVLVIGASKMILLVNDHLRGQFPRHVLPGIEICLVGLLMMIPFLMLGPMRLLEFHLTTLLLTAVLLAAGLGLSVCSSRSRLHRLWLPLVLMLILLFLLATIQWFPALAHGLRLFGNPLGAHSGVTATTENSPLWHLQGRLIWDLFTSSWVLAPAGLIWLGWEGLRRDEPEKLLFFAWSFLILLLTLGKNRFAYYLAVHFALLSAYFVFQVLRHFASTSRGPRPGWIRFLLATVLVGVALLPNVSPALRVAGQYTGPSSDWYSTLQWMRDSTPAPFTIPGHFDSYYPRPQSREYEYPGTAYGVMNWWNNGYWILKIARRIPITNPTQRRGRRAATYFRAQDEGSAVQVLRRTGGRFILIDRDLALNQQHPVWEAGSGRYFDTYFQTTEAGGLRPLTLFYPEYYRSMATRLYVFKGKAVQPWNSTWVVRYDHVRKLESATVLKRIRELKRFTSYSEAESFLRSQPGGNHRIVGQDPFKSCVPLRKLRDHKLIYQSPSQSKLPNGKVGAEVELFEFTGWQPLRREQS